MRTRILSLLGLALLLPAFTAQSALLFNTNAAWRWFKGTAEASAPITAWRQTAFNDAGWLAGSGPFFYGETITGGTLITDMQNNYSCIFLRKTFVLTNAAEVAFLELTAAVDDGFIAWVNGVEIARVGIGSGIDPTFQTLAAGAGEPVPYVTYQATNLIGTLVTGTNVVAIQVFNTTLGSSDLVFDAALVSQAFDPIPPTVSAASPAPGSTLNALTQVTVTFSERVAGVDAGDFLINNGNESSTMTSVGGTNYTFTFNQPLYGTVVIAWGTDHAITDTSFPPNPFDHTGPGASWTYNLVDNIPPTVTNVTPANTLFVTSLRQVEVLFSEPVTGVDVADLTINGSAATNITQISASRYLFEFPQPANGAVALQLLAGGIADLAAGTPNNFAGFNWSVTLDTNASGGDVIINEFAAANESGLRDEDNEESDWIELFNRGVNAVNLQGWALSDDPDLDTFWVFPSRIIPSGGYLVVLASAKDRTNPTGTNRLHTNFKLGYQEHLGLYSPDSPRRLVSGFTNDYPDQRNDVSFGYDGNGDLRYFATPTPGGPNGMSSVSNVVASVKASVARGAFTSPFNLYLNTDTPGATLRYTRDGSPPTEVNGVTYTNVLRVTNTLLLRVAAFKTNHLPSRVVTHSYFFGLSAAQLSLPIMSIVTASNNLIGRSGIIGMAGGTRAGDNLYITNNPATDYHNPSAHGREWEKACSVEYILTNGQQGFHAEGGLRVQGSDYARPRYLPSSKFSYRVYFRGDYGSGKLDYPLFPDSAVQSFDVISLRAGMNDQSDPFVRDEHSRRLVIDSGQVTPKGTLVNFFVNGEYKGYYNPTERVEEGFLSSWHGGGDKWDVQTQFDVTQEGDAVEFTSLRNFMGANAGQNLRTSNTYFQVMRRLDVTNMADYCLVNIYAAMGDWPNNNWRGGRERSTNGIWRYYMWDGEWASGFGGRANSINTFTDSGGGPSDSGLGSSGAIPTMFRNLTNSAEFTLLFADRIQRLFFNNGALSTNNVFQRFNELRTNMFGVLPGMTPFITQWDAPRRATLFNGPAGHINARGFGAYTNTPRLNVHGGRVAPGFGVTLTASNGGTIYYTTDGEDPRRMFFNTPAASAQVYSGAPVVLNQDTVFKTRALRGTNWSAVSEARFEIGTLGIPLRFTEIMYNPVGGANFEFLERRNLGVTPVNAGGFTLGGVTFIFPINTILAPGQIVVLANASAPAAWLARYPGVTPFGYFSGNLDNAGERVALLDGAGNLITSVDYRDNAGWSELADGPGRSLEINDAQGDPDAAGNWRASATTNATPGVVGSGPAAPNVRLNEILARNDGVIAHPGNTTNTFAGFIELHNAGGSAVSLANWSLTDDGNERRYVFPAGTTIAEGGYLVVWCADRTNQTPEIHTGFNLALDGETVSLFDTATNLVDIVTYGLSVPNRSVGRVDGAWTLTTVSTNAPNAAAPLGAQSSLALNEWLANALPAQPDWLELHNRDLALPVSLQGVYLANSNVTFRLGALSFLAAGGFVQLFADEGAGARHLDFKLSAAGDFIALSDSTALEIQRVSFGAQLSGVTSGRLPDGTGGVTNFAGSASPEAANYRLQYTGATLNEVLARNTRAATNSVGQIADFVEIFNPHGTNFPLAGMSLSLDAFEPGQFVFPAGVSVAPGGYLVVWCDGARPASTTAAPPLNAGRGLNGGSGGVHLFTAAGQTADFVEYGFQVENQSLGRSGGNWRLLTGVTPGAVNSPAAALSVAANVVFNEWLASSPDGADFFELFNADTNAFDLGGLFLTDDPSLAGRNKHTVAPLSFIPARGFVRYVADGDTEAGRDHVDFSLDADGGSVRLHNAANATLTAVFHTAQEAGVSEGLLPDGNTTNAAVRFPRSASPGESNYTPPDSVVVNEVLSFTAAGTRGVEFFNPSTFSGAIGGWWLSDSEAQPRKYRVPANTSLAPGGFLVIPESAFAASFTLDRVFGGLVVLSAADGAGNLTGVRARARYGAALPDCSFGRHVAPLGEEFPVQQSVTLGAANSGPRVGPVVIGEIHYNPPGGGDHEFVEISNLSGGAVDLFDPARPFNTWRLANGVEYSFSIGTTLVAGEHILVVGFDPADTAKMSAFTAANGSLNGARVFGPWLGRLDNAGERLDLTRPAEPAGPIIPQVVVDSVRYGASAPWPAAANGGVIPGGGGPGLAAGVATPVSLQRRDLAAYGNNPENWLASAPTPGAANGPGLVAPPVITQHPAPATNALGSTASLSVRAIGGGTNLQYQWRFEGRELPGQTASNLVLGGVNIFNQGSYDVYVYNEAGVDFSDSVFLTVLSPPQVIEFPTGLIVNPSNTVSFSVRAVGTLPMGFQWYFNGELIPGATQPTYTRENVQLADNGILSVVISNVVGSTSVSAPLIVLVPPFFIRQPEARVALVGETITFDAVADGTKPISYRWRRGGAALTSTLEGTNLNTTGTITVTNVQLAHAGEINVILTNAAFFGATIRSFNAWLVVYADADRDGMGDVWEQQNGFLTNNAADATLDTDGDGVLNKDEFRAGTDPRSTNSVLRLQQLSVARPAGDNVMQFPANSNRSFQVQYTENVNLTPWFNAFEVRGLANSNRVITFTNSPPPGVTSRVFRVVTPR